jgi:hypothetical protein
MKWSKGKDYNHPLTTPHPEVAMTKDEILKKHKQYLFPSVPGFSASAGRRYSSK